MIFPFIQGVLLGLTIAVLLGPALFALLQTSIHRGFRAGFFLAIGIFLSDVALVLLTYFGASQVLDAPKNQLYFGVIGGTILAIFGVVTFTRKVVVEEGEEVQVKRPSDITYLLKGFFLNMANPGVWFFWITVTVAATSNYGVHNLKILAFFIGALLTIFFTDVVKSYISNKIKSYITPTLMHWVNRIVGIILVGIGAYLALRVIYHW
ncbi:MAG: LysE family transporter [Bacteroidota bacterium]